MRTGEAETDEVETAGARLTVPLLLAAGWGALFSFMAMVLMDDAPAAPEPASPDAGIGLQATSFDMQPEPPAPPHSAERPRPQRQEPGPVATVREVGFSAERLAETAEAAPPRREVADAGPAPSVERADYIGTWGPTVSACGAPSRRRGYIPAVLTPDGARAGRTLCRFRNGRREGVGWSVAAECSERGRRWTSQVRLVVDGDRLTCTSGKGAASYVRCGRRDG